MVRVFIILLIVVAVVLMVAVVRGTPDELEFSATLRPAQLLAYQYMGDPVRLSANGEVAVAGAFGARGGRGAVHVFTSTGGESIPSSWSSAVKIVSPYQTASAWFGHGVAVDATGDRMVVGEPYATTNGMSHAGRAYVFKRSGGATWELEQELTAPVVDEDGNHGWDVGTSRDGQWAFVSARMSTGFGSVYVYTRSGTSWSFHEHVQAAVGQTYGGQYGYRISVGGGAGEVLVVGGYVDDSTGDRVYAYRRAPANGYYQASEHVITASDGAPFDYFGQTVAVSGDGTRAMVGAQGDGGDDSRAYVFVRSAGGNVWTEETILSSDVAGVEVGRDVALNGDGTMAVAKYADGAAVYVRASGTTTWTKTQQLTVAGSVQLGWSLHVNDAGNRVVLGDYAAANNAYPSVGAAHIFDGAATVVVPGEDSEWAHGMGPFDYITTGTDAEEDGCDESTSMMEADIRYDHAAHQYYHHMHYSLGGGGECDAAAAYAYASYRFQWMHSSARPDMSAYTHFSVWVRSKKARTYRFQFVRSGGDESPYFTVDAPNDNEWHNYRLDVSSVSGTIMDKLKSVHWSTTSSVQNNNVDIGHMSFTMEAEPDGGMSLPVSTIGLEDDPSEWAYVSAGEVAADPSVPVVTSSDSVAVDGSFETDVGDGPGNADTYHRMAYRFHEDGTQHHFYGKYFYQVQADQSARPDVSTSRYLSMWVRNSRKNRRVTVALVRSGHSTPDLGWIDHQYDGSPCKPAVTNTWTECVFFVDHWWLYSRMKRVGVRVDGFPSVGTAGKGGTLDVAYLRYTNDPSSLPLPQVHTDAPTAAATGGGAASTSTTMMSVMVVAAAAVVVVVVVAVGGRLRGSRVQVDNQPVSSV